MPFKKILVALDGSQYSQVAANYAFWLGSQLNAEITGQHVIDPRLAEFFIAPEFTEELGISESGDITKKVMSGLRKTGKLILELFAREAEGRGLKVKTHLDEGYTVEKILKRAADFDLLIMGHRGRGHRKVPQELLVGSTAERVAVGSRIPVLIAIQPIETITQALVAYDGSEPARGALFMAENLAKNAGLRLRAMAVVPSSEHVADAKLTIEQAEAYLREGWPQEVFTIRQGHTADTLMEYAYSTNSLLVLGAYGYRSPEENVMGSTTTQVVRKTQSSILIYKGIPHTAVKRKVASRNYASCK